MSMFIGVRSRAPKTTFARARRVGVAGLTVLLTVGFGTAAHAEGETLCHPTGPSWMPITPDNPRYDAHLEHGDPVQPAEGCDALSNPPVEEPPVLEPPVLEVLAVDGTTHRSPRSATVNRPPAEVKAASTTRSTRILPATGAPEDLALQSGGGILLVVLGALVLLRRRTRTS